MLQFPFGKAQGAWPECRTIMLTRFDRALRFLLRGLVLAIIVLAATATGRTTAAGKADVAVPAPPGGRVLLDKYCVGCHNDRLKTANLMLDKANVEDVGAATETWEKVLRKLR